MILVVDNKYINKGFILFLKRRILFRLVQSINIKKLSMYDEYFNDAFKDEEIDDVIISTKKVILLAGKNLCSDRFDTETHIYINPNINYPNTNIKLIDLCKIINYGTLSIEPYPIFSDCFNHFHKGIKRYINMFISGVQL